MHIKQYICECKEEVKIKATVEAMNVQRRGDVFWLTALASRTKGVKRMMDDNALLRVQTFTPKKLYQAHREDGAIGEVIKYKKKKKRDKAPPDLQSLLRVYKKLHIG